MKDQLEALVQQMYKSGILYSEAVREFKKRFLLTVLESNGGKISLSSEAGYGSEVTILLPFQRMGR